MPSRRTAQTPGATGVVGTAEDRPWDFPGESLEQYYTQHLHDPGFDLPPGFDVGDNGSVEHQQPSFLMAHPWLIPLMGVGAGAGIAALAGGGAAAAGGAGAEAGLADASAGGVTAGLPGEMATLPSIGSTAASAAAPALSTAIPATGEEALASGYGSIAGPSAGEVSGGLVGPASHSLASGAYGSNIWLPIVMSSLAGAAEGALAPTPFQPRIPYDNAQGLMTSTTDKANSLWSALTKQAARPISLPDAVVHPLPTFSGPNLPMAFGGEGAGPVGSPASLPGLDFSLSSSTPGGAIPRSGVNGATSLPRTSNPMDAMTGSPMPSLTPPPAPVRNAFTGSSATAPTSGGGDSTSSALALLHLIASGGGHGLAGA